MRTDRLFLATGGAVFVAGAVWLGHSLLAHRSPAKSEPAARRPSPLAHQLPRLAGGGATDQAPEPDPSPANATGAAAPAAPVSPDPPPAAAPAPTGGEFPAPAAEAAREVRIHELLTTRKRVTELSDASDDKSRAELAELRSRLAELERWAAEHRPTDDELTAAQARIDELRAAAPTRDTH
jgi:hypothetical protein